MPSPIHHHEVHECTELLRTALKDNGITLPSLGVDLPGFAGELCGPARRAR